MDDLLQGLLHGGVAVVAQDGGKADHRRFADRREAPQLACGHESGLVVVREDILRDPLLPLGEPGQVLPDDM